MGRREKAIERLTKRKNWLEERISKGELEGADLSYDKAELSSLNYALEELEKGYDE